MAWCADLRFLCGEVPVVGRTVPPLGHRHLCGRLSLTPRSSHLLHDGSPRSCHSSLDFRFLTARGYIHFIFIFCPSPKYPGYSKPFGEHLLELKTRLFGEMVLLLFIIKRFITPLFIGHHLSVSNLR